MIVRRLAVAVSIVLAACGVPQEEHKKAVDKLEQELSQVRADKDKFEAVDILRKFEVPCAPVLSMKEIAYDPALRASGSIVEVEQEKRGKYLTVGSPVKFSSFTPTITGAPLLGEHTAEVLAKLGYNAEQIAELHRQKVV